MRLLLLSVLTLSASTAQAQQPGTVYGSGGNPGQYQYPNQNGAWPDQGQAQVMGQPNGYGRQPYPASAAYPYPNYQGAASANPQGYAAGPPGSLPQAAAQPAQPTQPTISVNDWFARYNEIRHRAQMSTGERQRADGLMSRGISILIPGQEKAATKQLLISLVGRYQQACAELKMLPVNDQTKQLHYAYYQYFLTAASLFNDYVRVQDNILLADATTGAPLAAGLLQRKQMLEGFEHQVKGLDAQMRLQYHVPPYPY
jgi:hypothetical protein